MALLPTATECRASPHAEANVHNSTTESLILKGIRVVTGSCQHYTSPQPREDDQGVWIQ